MSPTMGEVQTMPCWRPQGVQQDDLITWTRTRSERESSEFVGFTLNDPMTALTTTSDFLPSTCQPVSESGRFKLHTCLIYPTTQSV